MARVASPRTRAAPGRAVLMPLWAAYLVKVYAWRMILQGNGSSTGCSRRSASTGPGLSEIANSWIVLSYLWLPYMILPIYAGLERIPSSLLEASADLGARGGHDVPAGRSCRSSSRPLVAGSIFTFSLTLGDYITPDLVSRHEVHRQRDLRQLGLGSLPLAAALLAASRS